MANSIKRILISASVIVLGFAAQTVSASAVSIHPMTFDECGTNADTSVYNCMYIDGSGLYASEVRGWADDLANSLNAYNSPVHEQVIGPDGSTYCNSSTITVTSSTTNSTVVGCQKYPDEDIAAGTYCSIL
jgi:hypothetical protein